MSDESVEMGRRLSSLEQVREKFDHLKSNLTNLVGRTISKTMDIFGKVKVLKRGLDFVQLPRITVNVDRKTLLVRVVLGVVVLGAAGKLLLNQSSYEASETYPSPLRVNYSQQGRYFHFVKVRQARSQQRTDSSMVNINGGTNGGLRPVYRSSINNTKTPNDSGKEPVAEVEPFDVVEFIKGLPVLTEGIKDELLEESIRDVVTKVVKILINLEIPNGNGGQRRLTEKDIVKVLYLILEESGFDHSAVDPTVIVVCRNDFGETVTYTDPGAQCSHGWEEVVRQRAEGIGQITPTFFAGHCQGDIKSMDDQVICMAVCVTSPDPNENLSHRWATARLWRGLLCTHGDSFDKARCEVEEQLTYLKSIKEGPVGRLKW